MRVVLLVLIGLGAGVALGSVFREAPDRSRRERRVVLHEVVRVRPPRPEPTPAGPEPRVTIEADEDRAPGFGIVEFDGRTAGARAEAWVRYRTPCGAWRESPGEEVEDGVTRFTLRPGVHEICCFHGPRLDRRHFRVEVLAGCVTHVSASEPATPDQFPIPAGMGRLDVTVFDLDNERSPETVIELGWTSPTGEYWGYEESTAEDGTVRYEVVPGNYEIWVGCRKRSIRIVEGEGRHLVFRYGHEGEVRIEGDLIPWIRPIDGQPVKNAHTYSDGGDRRAFGFLYVRPGSYEAYVWFRHEAERRSLGTLTASPGTITWFRPRDLPTASVKVAVHRPPGLPIRDAVVEVAPLGDRGEPGQFRHEVTFGRDEATTKTEARHVSPGCWRLRVTADGCDPVEREFEVGIESMCIEIQLQRSTIR